MFSVYGLTGPIFTGTFERFYEVHQIAAVQPLNPAAQSGDATSAEALERRWQATGDDAAYGQGAPQRRFAGANVYEKVAHSDVERGPLYRAEQIMQRRVIVLGVDESVEEAWRLLHRHTIHQAPVLDAGEQLVGLVSERDLLHALNVDSGVVRDVLSRKVRDMMTTPVVCADPATDIRQIARVMLDHHVDGVPIIGDTHQLTGFISRTDILNAVVREPPLSLWR